MAEPMDGSSATTGSEGIDTNDYDELDKLGDAFAYAEVQMRCPIGLRERVAALFVYEFMTREKAGEGP